MNYKLLIILLLILSSCADVNSVKNYNIIDKSNKFSNYGFTLIYSDNLHAEKIVNKKINERDLIVFQKNLKKGVSVKITNPNNGKSLIASVGKNSSYPIFNNSVVSKRIADELELKTDEPYIKIEEILQNSSFVAKKAKTYEVEKTVANKAPVDEITINNLNKKNKTIKEKNISSEFNYSIKIADFFFMNSAKLLKNRILNESTVKNINILEISKNKFRVILGPYLDLKSLQKDYSNIYNLNFENLEIIKND